MFELMTFMELCWEKHFIEQCMDRLRKEPSIPRETRIALIKRFNVDRQLLKQEIKERC